MHSYSIRDIIPPSDSRLESYYILDDNSQAYNKSKGYRPAIKLQNGTFIFPTHADILENIKGQTRAAISLVPKRVLSVVKETQKEALKGPVMPSRLGGKYFFENYNFK